MGQRLERFPGWGHSLSLPRLEAGEPTIDTRWISFQYEKHGGHDDQVDGEIIQGVIHQEIQQPMDR